ncbi:MAG: hypothetical protein AAF937_02850 [Planctomycetota bacterium]
MRFRARLASLMVLHGLVAHAGLAAAQATATLRGRDARVIDIERFDGSAVIGEVAGSRVVLTWDRVRAVDGSGDAALARLLSAGDALWRGKTRLDRGDPIAAVAALEQAFDVFSAEPGHTARVSSDALLAARLALGQAERSVVPWLHLREQSAALLDAPGALRTETDEEWGLVQDLPPIFVPSRSAARIAADVAADGLLGWTEGPNRRLAEVYASALLIAAGESPPPLDWEPPSEPVGLVRSIVEARSDDPRRRAVARADLRRWLADQERSWVKAWCHAAIGLSLLNESESERLAGIGHLLIVPSVYGDAQPYLAGVCLAEAAQALANAGRAEAAARLVDTLSRRSPRHPALALPSLRGLRAAATSSQTNGIGT